MAKEFPLVPAKVQPVSTKHRKISGMIPHPKSIKRLEELREEEAQSMRGQPPIIWDKAEGINVFDAFGNKWLDYFYLFVWLFCNGRSLPKRHSKP